MLALELGLVISAHFRYSVCLVLFIVADTVIKEATKNRHSCALFKERNVGGHVK